MSKIVWDQAGERLYETGVDQGVVYPKVNGEYPSGYGWNGLTSVEESPSGAEATALWADNIKYLNLISNEEFGCTINAYTFPDEFKECDGTKTAANGLVEISGQTRKYFGFTYRSLIGNDEDGTDYGYKIHLVYGCSAAPSSKTRSTTNDSPEAQEFSWTITTTPEKITAKDANDKPFKPTAHLVIDSTKFKTEPQKALLASLEGMLYGVDGTAVFTQVDKTETPTPVEGTDYYIKTGTGSTEADYTKVTVTTWEQDVTYYTKSISGDSAPYLPLPDAVITALTAS